MKQNIVIYVLTMIITVIFLNTLTFPNKFLLSVMVFISVSYPFWRKKRINTVLVTVITTYWFYVAWFRVSNSIMFLFVTNTTYTVSTTKAMISVLPLIIIPIVFIIDHFFISPGEKDDIKISFLNIDLLQEDDQEWINEIKEENINGKSWVAYSRHGSESAQMKAKKLGIENVFIEFLDDKEVKKRRKW